MSLAMILVLSEVIEAIYHSSKNYTYGRSLIPSIVYILLGSVFVMGVTSLFAGKIIEKKD
ncbi:hypothetical protein [Anaerobacillus sp. CMMVII]|uniref:hypothetical protein n=1 Tax=Anaerobacillus sp. CMMVII TaxID=2755588 RepID=UPI0021B70C35|nr:hypothetical protein [Anaerobacillus sp. CMMVII]